jgi:hypothetical protein
MCDNDNVNLPLGVPFMGGSDDPSDIVGTEGEEEGGEDQSCDDMNPGV